jgi:dTDP-4-dehydrorhamnose 3,5-epimerase-like enzyme/Flp pilus assembly protein TadD
MISQDALATRAEVAYPEYSLPENEALERAEAFLESGLVSEAAEIYEEIITRGGDSPRVQMGLAQCAYRQRKLHEALGHLQAALQSAPDHPSVHNDLGVVLFELGLPEEASAAFEQALAKHPNDPQPLRNLMDVAVARDDWNGCIACCEQILLREPEDDEVKQVLEAARLRASERAAASNRPAPAEPAEAPRGYRVVAPPESVPEAVHAWLDEPTPAAAEPNETTDNPLRSGAIDGVAIQARPAQIDERGYRIEVARAGDGPAPSWIAVEGNLKAGIARGFHRHAHRWEWIFVGRGAAKIVLIDERRGSSTENRTQTVVAGERNPTRIAVPPGVLHGWVALADETEVLIASSEPDSSDRIEDSRRGALLCCNSF